MRTRRRKRRALLLALISAVASLVVFAASGTSQAEVAPVVDYATYPPDLPTCAGGPAALVGVEFATPTAGPVTNLRDLAVVPGDVITMSWDGFTAGCEGVGVGFSSKVASVPVFDQGTDYWLYEFAYCGPEADATATCAATGNTLTLQVPPAAEVPCYQLDAHLGAPLAQVGPTTDYYSLNGEKNLLISALNGGLDQATCEAAIVECATNPAIPSTAFLCQGGASSTTAPPTTTPPTTVPPTTAPAPSTTAAGSCAPGQTPNPSTGVCEPTPTTATSSPSVAPTTSTPTPTSAPIVTGQPACGPNQVFDATNRQCRPVNDAQGGALPVTGRDSRSLATTGALLLLSGLCIAYAYRRPSVDGALQD